MKLLIFGASGGCGRCLVKIAQERGHQVRAIVREETPFEISRDVEVIRGSVLDKKVLEKGLEGSEAVLSALGIKRKNPRNPWSSIVSPVNLTTHVADNLVQLMPEFGVKRFIGISAAGVRESFEQVNQIIKWMISKSNMKASYEDLGQMESIFEKSGVDWMAVRPVTLIDGMPSGKIKETNYYGLLNRIKRSDVAIWMLNKVEQEESFLNRTPMITSG